MGSEPFRPVAMNVNIETEPCDLLSQLVFECRVIHGHETVRAAPKSYDLSTLLHEEYGII
jgi:hypothetical protein